MSSQIDPTLPVDGAPAVKADLRANLATAKAEIEALQLGKLAAGDPIDMQDAVITRPELKDYAEASTSPQVAGAMLTLDLEASNVFDVTLTEDVATLVLINPPAAGRAGSITLIVRQDAVGGHTIAWPAAVSWSAGAPPVVTAAAAAVDVYLFLTVDGGATWLGLAGGQNFG